jgi:hypothetical protein
MMSFNKPEPMMITIKNHGRTVSAELPWDCGLDEIYETMQGLLIANGWSNDGIESHIIEIAENLKEYNENFKQPKNENQD